MMSHSVEIFVELEPIELRWIFDHFAEIIAERIGRSG